MLKVCLDTEQQLGRERKEKWGPRIIDIDVLLYDEQVVDCDELKIPHPYLHERIFVLKPLHDLDENLRHPTTGKKISEYLQELSAEADSLKPL